MKTKTLVLILLAAGGLAYSASVQDVEQLEGASRNRLSDIVGAGGGGGGTNAVTEARYFQKAGDTGSGTNTWTRKNNFFSGTAGDGIYVTNASGRVSILAGGPLGASQQFEIGNAAGTYEFYVDTSTHITYADGALQNNGNCIFGNAITDVVTISGILTNTGAAVINGNVTLGDASTDTVTINGVATYLTNIVVAPTVVPATGTGGLYVNLPSGSTANQRFLHCDINGVEKFAMNGLGQIIKINGVTIGIYEDRFYGNVAANLEIHNNNSTTSRAAGLALCANTNSYVSTWAGIETTELSRIGQVTGLRTFTGRTYKQVTTGTNYLLSVSDHYVLVKGTTATVQTNTLPAASFGVTNGTTFVIKDAQLSAATTNIVIMPSGSDKIDGASSLLMNANGQSRTVTYDGANWYITAGYL